MSTETRFDHVRQYLVQNADETKNRLQNTNCLQNSNTIGLGYNPLLGSPVCYSGHCQYDGFKRSIFNLTFAQPTSGSRIPKLISNNVELYCFSSSGLSTTTETINTLEQLSKSTSSSISFGADVQYKMFSAGYN
ncbi:unnamed protein product [Rotaria sp. Silwood1]|nr:unnamed protein product [Rotaria sp. Silwood1]CAF1590395.1 unnamed protein product [Rotaria sp. Silwood1]